MLLHPAFRLLIGRPELLAEHVGAYAELAAAEAGEAAAGLRLKAGLALAAVACAALGAVLAGTAVLLLAALPLQQMPAPWALALAPALPWLAALLLWLAQRRQVADLRFLALREQLAADRALWQAPAAE
jgi:hypothetical protein